MVGMPTAESETGTVHVLYWVLFRRRIDFLLSYSAEVQKYRTLRTG